MKRTMFKKAKSSFLGRTLRRLFGEETGAVMMEYIVLALMIAAACVLAVAFFGTTITGMFASLAHSVAGDQTAAANVQNATGAAIQTDFTAAKAHNDSKHNGTSLGDTAGSQSQWQ